MPRTTTLYNKFQFNLKSSISWNTYPKESVVFYFVSTKQVNQVTEEKCFDLFWTGCAKSAKIYSRVTDP